MSTLVVLWLFIIQCVMGSHVMMPPRVSSKPIPGDSPIQMCDLTIPQSLDIHNIDLTPNPPMRDSNLTIRASGWLAVPVEEDSYVDIEVRLGYIKLLTQRFDLCDLLEQQESSIALSSGNDMTCPVVEGAHKLVKTVKIPREVPVGKYTFIARAYSQDDTLLTCLTGDFIFPPYAS